MEHLGNSSHPLVDMENGVYSVSEQKSSDKALETAGNMSQEISRFSGVYDALLRLKQGQSVLDKLKQKVKSLPLNQTMSAIMCELENIVFSGRVTGFPVGNNNNDPDLINFMEFKRQFEEFQKFIMEQEEFHDCQGGKTIERLEKLNEEFHDCALAPTNKTPTQQAGVNVDGAQFQSSTNLLQTPPPSSSATTFHTMQHSHTSNDLVPWICLGIGLLVMIILIWIIHCVVVKRRKRRNDMASQSSVSIASFIGERWREPEPGFTKSPMYGKDQQDGAPYIYDYEYLEHLARQTAKCNF